MRKLGLEPTTLRVDDSEQTGLEQNASSNHPVITKQMNSEYYHLHGCSLIEWMCVYINVANTQRNKHSRSKDVNLL